ncbi:MAG: autotransporter domain-containing protein [Akkermansia sp.]|nr:autotransporter domain-containing protein [Akkermansia sp.]
MKPHLPLLLRQVLLAVLSASTLYAANEQSVIVQNRVVQEREETKATSNTELESKAYGTLAYNITNAEEILYRGNKSMAATYITTDYSNYYCAPSAYVYGGALYSAGDLTLSGNTYVTFDANYVEAYAEAKCTTSTYYDNQYPKAEAYGGAICTISNTLTLANNSQVAFKNNTACASHPTLPEDARGIARAYGGAIANKFGDTIFNNNGYILFDNNAATTGGAAFYSEDGDISFLYNGTITIKRNQNEAFLTKGAITLTGTSTLDVNNNAGGVLCGKNVYLTLNTHVNFTDNTLTQLYDDGGAINCYNLTMNDNVNITFSGNKSENCGGAIYAWEGLQMNNNQSITFTLNEASSACGAMAIYGTNNKEIGIAHNGTITFSKNKVSSTYTWSDNDSAINLSDSLHAGALRTGGRTTFEDNTTLLFDSNSVFIKASATSNSAYAYYKKVGAYLTMKAFGGALYATNSLNFISNGNITFKGSSVSSSTTSVATNYTESDQECRASGYAYVGGSAIYLTTKVQESLWKGNHEINFINNSALASSTADTAETQISGGVLHIGTDNTLIIEKNENILFNQNSAHAESYNVDAYKTSFGSWRVGESDSYIYGGVIYADTKSKLVFNDNTYLKFTDNVSTSYTSNMASVAVTSSDSVELTSLSDTCGGVFYCNNSVCDFYTNGFIEFSGNSVSNTASLGAGISGSPAYAESSILARLWGGVFNLTSSHLNIIGNSDVIFRENTICATSIKESTAYPATEQHTYTYGAAIYVDALSTFTLAYNDDVLFEKNTEINNGNFRLRSIHSGGTVNLSAGFEHELITFYDSITAEGNDAVVNFNSDVTTEDGNTLHGFGNIIFSGEFTAEHLNDMLTKNGKTRTATSAEIADSRTSYAETAYLHNGKVSILDNAVFSGQNLTLLSSTLSTPTLELRYGSLAYSNGTITLQSGTKLKLTGSNNSIAAASLVLEKGSTLHAILSSENTANTLLSFTGNMQISSGCELFIDTDTSLPQNGTYKLLTVNSKPNSWNNITITNYLGLQDIRWEGNTLVADFDARTWSNASGNNTWDSTSRNWRSGSTTTTFAPGRAVAFTDAAGGNITLKGNLAPALIWVENSSGNDYSFSGSGAITGKAQLQKLGKGTLSISTANSYTGGTIIHNGTIKADNAKAFGSGQVVLHNGTLNLNNKALCNDIYAHGGTISGGSAYAGTLHINGCIQNIGKLHADKGIELTYGYITGGSIVDTSLTINAPNDYVWVDSSLEGAYHISLLNGGLDKGSLTTLGAQQSLAFDGGFLYGDITTTNGAMVSVAADGYVEGNVTLEGGNICFAAGKSLDIDGNLTINGPITFTLDGDYVEDQTYTLISASGNISVDFGKLAGVIPSLGDRYGCIFATDSKGLTVTIEEIGSTLTWAGGNDDVWAPGGGVWEEDRVFCDNDTVILIDGIVQVKGNVTPKKVYIKTQNKLTLKSESYADGIGGKETSVIIEAAPNATITFELPCRYYGDTIIRSGTVLLTQDSYFYDTRFVMEGGVLNIANRWFYTDVVINGTATILKGKNYSGDLTILGGELTRGSVLSSYNTYLQGGVINGTLTCSNSVQVTGAAAIGATGKLNTDNLRIFKDGILTTSAKGLTLNAKSADINITGGKLISLNKLSAYSLSMNGGVLDIATPTPTALTFNGEMSLTNEANISVYGKLTAGELQMSGSTITMNMEDAYITEKNIPKPQSLTLKNKEATNILTGSELSLNGSMSVAGNLSLVDTDLIIENTPAAKPKALGLTAKGNLNMEKNALLHATGKVSAASLTMKGNSTLKLINEKPQSLALSGKTNAAKQPITNYLADSKLFINGSMSVASHLSMQNTTIRLWDANTAKPKALGLTVKGDMTFSGNSELYLSGALSAKNLTLGSGSIFMTGSKLQTIKVGNKLTLNEDFALNLQHGLNIKKDKKYKLITFKTLNGFDTETDSLYEALGLNEEFCTLALENKAITLTVTAEQWDAYVAAKETEKEPETEETPEEPNPVATAAEEVEDMLFAPAPVAAEMAPELQKVADTLVQCTWGTVGASRAFTDTIANRGAYSTLFAGGRGAAWVSTMGGSSRISSDGGHAGADYTLTGAAFGIEARVTEDSTIGLAIGNSWGKVNTLGAYAVDGDYTHQGIYGNHKLNDALTLSWAATHTRTEADATILGMPCDWSQDALQLDARLTWTQALNERTAVSVFGGMQYLATDKGESNGLSTGSLQNLRAEIGVGASHKFSGNTMVYGELSFVGDMVRNNPTATVGDARAHGANPGRAGLNLSTGATHRLNERWSLNGSYNFEWMQNVTSHSLNVGASYNF